MIAGIDVAYSRTDRNYRNLMTDQCEFIGNIVRLYKVYEPNFTCGSDVEIRKKLSDMVFTAIPDHQKYIRVYPHRSLRFGCQGRRNRQKRC